VATPRSQLSDKADRILARYGVQSPDQLLNLTGALSRPEDAFDDTRVGLEIIEWAREAGVTYGPSADWLTLFNAIADLSAACRRALWCLSFATRSPKDLGIEDIAVCIRSDGQKAFRAWAVSNQNYFGVSGLDGLSEEARRHLIGARLFTPEAVAACTRNEVRFIRGPRRPIVEEVENWLAGKGLSFATDNPFTANLSEPAQSVAAELNVRDTSGLVRLRLHDFVTVERCTQQIVDEIQAWARAQGVEIPA
jgi:hypothetical protein